MTQMRSPSITDAVVGSLRHRTLFEFVPDALAELATFHDSLRDQAGLSPASIEQGRAVSHLNSAEFSLIPALVHPEAAAEGLPPTAPVQVGLEHARLALLKGDCSLILWTHAVGGPGTAPIAPADVAVFGGDISKLGRLHPAAAADGAAYPELVPALEDSHRSSHWRPAQQVAELGILRLQQLLWTLKTAVAAPDAADRITRTVEQFTAQGDR